MADELEVAAWSSEPVALVFTDVEHSTELWQIDEDAFGWALLEHDEEVRTCLASHRGQEVKHTGDGFFLAFERMGDAARFALHLQTRLENHAWPDELGPVRVRMGLHHGSTRFDRFGDLRGPAVNLAARVCHSAHGGRILMTDAAVRELQPWPELVSRAQAVGAYALRGINGVVELFELCCEATQHLVFPPIQPEAQEPAEEAGEGAGMSSRDEESKADREAWVRARLAMQNRDHETAITELLGLYERWPESVRVLTTLGVAYAWAEQYDRAEHCLNRAVELDPNHAPAWFNLARVYGKMGRRHQIGQALAMTLQADPGHTKARSVAEKYGVEIPALPPRGD